VSIYEAKDIGSKTDTLIGTASTDTFTIEEFFIGGGRGSYTLALSPTLNSGTAVDVTLTFALRMKGFNYGTYATLATLTAADITAGTDNYVSLSDVSGWMWADYVSIIATSASGTYNISLEYQIKGQ